MAYDPATGQWKDEDTSVEKRLNELTSKDSDYMRQASTQGFQMANRRGLLNSSMAIGAAQAARLDRALPIAQQEAGQTHERQQLGRQLQSSDIQQQRDIGARERMQQTDIEAQREAQQREIQAARERLERELTSREGMQQIDIAAQERIARMNVGASERADASRMATQFELAYTGLLESIMANPNIPADVRQEYMNHAARIRDSNLALVEQMYGIDLQWS